MFLIVFCLIIIISLLSLFIYNKNSGILLVQAILYGYIIFYSFYAPTRTDFIRYLMPTYFCLSIIGSIFIFNLLDLICFDKNSMITNKQNKK